jgi:hypothetical protein
MKNLELNGLGVQEMNATEMREVDGGWFWVGLALGLILGELNDRNSGSDFREGFKDAMK